MPKTSESIQPGKTTSILVVGDSGTRKTRFAAGCPKPYVFDFDNGMLSTRDIPGVEFDTFRDAPRGTTVTASMKAAGIFDYGKSWPEFVKRVNEIGLQMDKGTCPYQTLVIDSLTLMAESAMNHVLVAAGRTAPEQRDWGAFLGYMRTVIGQLTSWPILLVLTAHIKRDENDLTKQIEKLPLVSGQFSGMVSVFFDEVYYTEVKPDGRATFVTKATPNIRQAKSRLNVPDGIEASWAALAPYMQGSLTGVKP